jgi:hypothetical protein
MNHSTVSITDQRKQSSERSNLGTFHGISQLALQNTREFDDDHMMNSFEYQVNDAG